MTSQYYEGVGRRKASTARARLFVGDGSVVCNGRPAQEYFCRPGDFKTIMAPLQAVGVADKYSLSLQVKGGGLGGQSGAACLAIARALLKIDPSMRSVLREGGYLTRDDRIKERKKPGLKRARKAPTFTKR